MLNLCKRRVKDMLKKGWFRNFIHWLSHVVFVTPPHEWKNKNRD